LKKSYRTTRSIFYANEKTEPPDPVVPEERGEWKLVGHELMEVAVSNGEACALLWFWEGTP
jgi:hypothetical protein